MTEPLVYDDKLSVVLLLVLPMWLCQLHCLDRRSSSDSKTHLSLTDIKMLNNNKKNDQRETRIFFLFS